MTALRFAVRPSGSGAVSALRRDDWRDRGACTGADRGLFDPDGADAWRELGAKAVCGVCPVRAECERWGIQTRQKHGVWGGTSQAEREQAVLTAGRRLAVGNGLDVILARLEGQGQQDIADWAGISIEAVRYALRLLLPEAGRARTTPLERVLADSDVLRVMARAGRTDGQIGAALKATAATVADARSIVAHVNAARKQMGLTA